jgi:hypothetical protein
VRSIFTPWGYPSEANVTARQTPRRWGPNLRFAVGTKNRPPVWSILSRETLINPLQWPCLAAGRMECGRLMRTLARRGRANSHAETEEQTISLPSPGRGWGTNPTGQLKRKT